MISYNPDGSKDESCTYKYDSKGNMIEEVWYNTDGKLSKKYRYKYDEKGNQIEMDRYEGRDSLICKKTPINLMIKAKG